MSNPFRIEAIRPGQPFCDRQGELALLLDHARDFRNVMLTSPRRYGKTSLALRAEDALAGEGFVCVHADFFGADSVEDVARRIGRALLRGLDRRESLLHKGKRFLKGLSAFRPVFKPSGDGFSLSVERASESIAPEQLLENTLDDLAHVAAEAPFPLYVVLDEFQEITRLKESGQIEGMLRAATQGMEAGFLFLGSRRGVLRAIFNERKRPLFQSALPMELGPLPADETVRFLCDLFAQSGKRIAPDDAAAIHALVAGYPYYVQRLAGEVHQGAGETIAQEDIDAALRRVVHGERYGYQAVLAMLTPGQIRILRAVAAHPERELQSAHFVALAGAPASSIAFTARRLAEEDLIEQGPDARWRVVDPVFGLWLGEL